MHYMTIKEAILNDCEDIPGWVYVIREGNVVFYVGISQDPVFRLCQHVGVAGRHTYIYSREKLLHAMENGPALSHHLMGSPVGELILENAPESLGWSFDIYEKEDAIAVVKRTPFAHELPRMLEMMEVEWYEQRAIVESALIEELRPCLNRMGKKYRSPLPARYIKRSKIANEGVILE